MFRRRALLASTAVALLGGALTASSTTKLSVKPGTTGPNPPAYARFSQPLNEADRGRHALERLTFGARPGDLAQLQQIGLGKWLDEQLHPERIPENPLLAERLTPLSSLNLTIHETYSHYPSPQMIAAFARGRGALPDDPVLRAIVVQLADRYLQKKGGLTQAAQTNAASADPNDTSDLEPRRKLSTLLTPVQMQTLAAGTPENKRQLLADLPPDKYFDFAWALGPPERRKLMNLAPGALRRDLMLTLNPRGVVVDDLNQAKLFRAIYSNRQLAELLDDFWFNHFNVFANKGGDRYLLPTYERETIRPHILGSFYDLLLATAKSPAMLFYLDNWQSVGPQAPARPGKPKRGLNENYGRELLELHTLGVDGGYTQKDVIAVARCFTGWTIAPPRQGGEFQYNDKLHDKGSKLVLGHIIKAGGGMDDGLQVLALLARQPATAHHISFELAQRFVADDPPPSLVNRMAKTFLKTKGDLRQVTRVMLTSPEFWSQGAYRAKVKTPFEMVVSAVRASDANVTAAYQLAGELQRLGEPLYRKIEPTGYSNANSEWVSSAALLERMNFALALAHNRFGGVTVDTAAWDAETSRDPLTLARLLLGEDPSDATRGAIARTLASSEAQQALSASARLGPPQVPGLVAGLALGSPEFQRR